MPRKTSSAGKLQAAAQTLKAVRVELDLATHSKLRIEAARRDQSMASLVRNLIEVHLTPQASTRKQAK